MKFHRWRGTATFCIDCGIEDGEDGSDGPCPGKRENSSWAQVTPLVVRPPPYADRLASLAQRVERIAAMAALDIAALKAGELALRQNVRLRQELQAIAEHRRDFDREPLWEYVVETIDWMQNRAREALELTPEATP